MNKEQQDLIVDVCQGNLGALKICMDLIQVGCGYIVDEMQAKGIRGPRVWLCYKDLGDQTLSGLIQNVRSDDIMDRLAKLSCAPEKEASDG